jgi:hypothetical protein
MVSVSLGITTRVAMSPPERMLKTVPNCVLVSLQSST